MSKAEKYLQQWREVDRKSYISSTTHHLSFLASVVKYPSLMHGKHLTNAVRRYEMYWLPLCKKHGTMLCEEWAAPLDVAWVWYLHMLMPEYYVNDCICLIGNAPNHALKSRKEFQAATKLTQDLWDQSYANIEPFDVDLDKSIDVQEYKPKLKHDFTRQSTKQLNFYYQVSLPHYQDEKFLDSATQRYVTHLGLQLKNPSFMLSLPVDVQLIMYSHQLNPIFYNYQITVMLGKITSPVCRMGSTDSMGRQCQNEEVTKKCWAEAGVEFYKPGTLYRGEPPLLLNSTDQHHINRFAMLRQDYSLSVTQIDLENLDIHSYYLLVFEGSAGEEIYKAKIKVGEDKPNANFLSMGSENGVEYVQLEDFPSDKQKAKGTSKVSGFTHPMYSLLEDTSEQPPGNHGDPENAEENITHAVGDGRSTLVQINTSTSDTRKVKVSLYQIDRSRLHTEKILIGESDLDIFKFLEPKDVKHSPSKDEKKQKICLPLDFQGDGPHIRVTMTVSPIGCGHYVFQVSPEYGFAKFKHICSALSHPNLMLPLSTITAPETPSEVMTYPILNYRGEKAFTCRIVRSVASTEVFYAVEILDNKGNVAATSHLLPSNALPYKTDLASSRGCAYFSNDKTENAMLIRGKDDWGLCLGRKVSSPHFGKRKPSVLALKLFLLRDNANCYCPVQKFKNSLYMFKVPSLLSEQQNIPYVYLHLSDGKFVMSSDVTEVPEILALALSTLVLQYLFCDKDQDCWAIIDGEDADLFSIFQSSDNLGFAWDGKYDGGEGGKDDPCSFVSEIDC